MLLWSLVNLARSCRLHSLVGTQYQPSQLQYPFIQITDFIEQGCYIQIVFAPGRLVLARQVPIEQVLTTLGRYSQHWVGTGNTGWVGTCHTGLGRYHSCSRQERGRSDLISIPITVWGRGKGGGGGAHALVYHTDQSLDRIGAVINKRYLL